MLDFGDLLSIFDAIDLWRLWLCIAIATIIYALITYWHPGELPGYVALLTFGPGTAIGIYWEYSVRKERRRR